MVIFDEHRSWVTTGDHNDEANMTSFLRGIELISEKLGYTDLHSKTNLYSPSGSGSMLAVSSYLIAVRWPCISVGLERKAF